MCGDCLLDIGVSTSCYKGKDLLSVLENLLQSDIQTVEIRWEKEDGVPSIWPWDLDVEILKKQLVDFETIGFHLPFKDINPVSLNPKIASASRKILFDCISCASDLGGKYLVMHCSSYSADNHDNWIDFIRVLGEKSKEQGLMFCIENAAPLIDLEVLCRFVRDTGRNGVKIMLDTGHAFTRMKTSPFSFAMRYFDKTVHHLPFTQYMPYHHYGSLKRFIGDNNEYIFGFHIHDNDGNIDHLNLGQGMIDFGFLDSLEVSGFIGPIILETRMLDETDLAANLDFIRNRTKTMIATYINE